MGINIIDFDYFWSYNVAVPVEIRQTGLFQREVTRKKDILRFSPVTIPRPENTSWGQILIPEEKIAKRVAEMAFDIVANHKSDELMVVEMLNGASVFGADLRRAMRRHGLGEGTIYDSMRAESYSGSRSGKLKMKSEPKYKKQIRGRDIVIFEDIIDSGKTMTAAEKYFIKKGARSVTVVTLISKPHRREVPYEADYTGFVLQVDDQDPDPHHLWSWVEGYGLDTEGINRDNPNIVIGHERPKPAEFKGLGIMALARMSLNRLPFLLRGNIFKQKDLTK